MNLADYVQLCTLLSTIIAAIGIIIGIFVYRRQMNAQVFLEYTKRYAEIMHSIPQDFRGSRLQFDGEPPKPCDELTLFVLRYLNLCSEEYYLCQRRYLSRGIWGIWEGELKRTLRSPLLRREWDNLSTEFSSYPEFKSFVEKTQSTTIHS